MRDAYGRVQADDPGRALERVGGAHQRLDQLGRPARALQRQQAGRQERRLALRLDAEQLHHRVSAQVLIHNPRLRNAAKTRRSSRIPTLRPFAWKTARLKLTAGLARVAGTWPSC